MTSQELIKTLTDLAIEATYQADRLMGLGEASKIQDIRAGIYTMEHMIGQLRKELEGSER